MAEKNCVYASETMCDSQQVLLCRCVNVEVNTETDSEVVEG
jgi:hypothetical protein